MGKVIVHVRGSLDADAAEQLKHRLVDLIDGQGNRRLVLDLQDLTFIDRTGFSVLLDARRRMNSIGGKLVLSGPATTVAQALRASGLDKVFAITPTWNHPSNAGIPSYRDEPAGWGHSG